MGNLNRKTEIVILVASMLFVIGSVIAGFCWPTLNLFCRSGSIMVLGGAVVAYRLGVLQQSANDDALVAAGLGIPISGSLSNLEERLAFTAHLFLIQGSLIWGYGDFIL